MVTHRLVDAGGVRIHVALEGEGPLVLFVHGFPESWYSWRYQLPTLAAAGYRAAAIDVRGYGRSATPAEVDAYGMLDHVADNVGVLAALGEERAVIVGHDWGSPIAANTALLRPDLFPAVALLSVPYAPRTSGRPTETFAAMSGDAGEFYITYFQEEGRAEQEMEEDPRAWLAGFYVGASGDRIKPADGGDMVIIPPGRRLSDRFAVGDSLPSWLSEADLDYYAGEFERSGFRGPLNRYRNMDRDWADLRAWHHAPLRQPSLFIGGEWDGPTVWGAGAISRFPDTMPGVAGSHILPRTGHWVQQERADEVNRLLIDWLAGLG